MADQTYSYNASDPASYSAMELRRRIAERMISNRKGYPKTLGEGLTAIGDSIGDIGIMKWMERQQAALDAQRKAGAAAAETGGAPKASPQASADEDAPVVNIAGDVTDNAAPVQTAAAPQAAPVLPPWGGGAVAANNLYQPAAAPDDSGGETYPQTALAPTGTVSDAPPIGIRNTIAARPMNSLFPAPGVPQPNPTQAGPDAPSSDSPLPASIPPSTLAALQAGSPAEAAGNRPIVTDIPARVAQAQLPPQSQMPPAVPGPGAPAQPVPPALAEPRVPVPPQFTTAPVRPADPIEPTKTPRQIYNERALNQTDDPYMQNVHKNIIAQEEKLRADEYARRVEKWKSDMTHYQSQDTAWQEYQRNKPKTELETQKLEDERQQRAYAEKINRGLGGIPQDKYIANIEKSHEAVKNIPASAMSIANARRMAIDEKMFTGSDAEINTSLNKLGQVLGFPADPRVSATEQFKTYMAGVTAQQRQALVGGANISNADLVAAKEAAGAQVTLSRNTILAALRAAENVNTVMAVEHQKKLRGFALDDPDRQKGVYGQYGLPMEQIVPQGAVDRLRQHANDPAVHREFDDTFHTPGLSLKVLKYRGGY